MSRRGPRGGRHEDGVWYHFADGSAEPVRGRGGRHAGGMCGLIALALIAAPALIGSTLLYAAVSLHG